MNKLFTTLAAAALALPAMALESGTIGAYTIDPAPGEVEQLSTIKLDFTGTEFMGIDFPTADLLKAITLKSADTSYYVVKGDYYGSSDITLHFALSGTDTEVESIPAGTYTLTVPEKTFFEYFSTTKYNDEITAEYTVKGGGSSGPAQPTAFSEPTVTPAPDGVYGKLERITLTFPNLSNGMEWPIADPGKITLRREGDKTVYVPNSPTLGGTAYNELSLGFNKAEVSNSEVLTFTQEGVYTLELAAGALAEYQHPEVTSGAMSFTFFVDPSLNFSYELEPNPEACYENLTVFTVKPGETISDIAIADATKRPTLSLDGTTIALSSEEREGNVVLSITSVSNLTPGDWTLSIPAGYLTGTSKSTGAPMSNHEAITAIYKVRKAESFPYTITPENGSVVDALGRITIAFSGEGLKQVSYDTAAGSPVITGPGIEAPEILEPTLSGKSLELVCARSLADGTYTVSVPGGYIVTTDGNGLTSTVGAIDIIYTVKAPEAPDFNKGIIVLNEGWFGHDNGSVNFFPTEGPVYYNAFTLQNPSQQLGATTQSGQLYGDRLFAVSKMAPYLTGIDSDSFKMVAQLDKISEQGANPQPHAFCAVSPRKGYLSTSNGLFVVDLTTYTVSKELTAGWDAVGNFGQLLRYGNHVFAASQLYGIIAIDVDTDETTEIDVITTAAFAVTPNGSLYAVTTNESNEFVKIDPVTFETENVDIDAEKAKIQSPWETWRESSVAADRDKEIIYFARASWAPRTISKYDFTTGEYTPDFITLPGTADGLAADQVLYGQGISVDPATGYIVLTATEDGYGTHYQHNWLYFYDPATGRPVEDKTVVLRDYYWFPAMTLYPDFTAPELAAVEPLKLLTDEGAIKLDIASTTTLATGNRHLVNYSASSSDALVATVAMSTDGELTVTPVGSGETTLTVEASYMGRGAKISVPVSVNVIGIDSIGSETVMDVYTLTGIVVKRGATADDIARLPEGIYIIGGKKTVIRR